MYFPCSEPQEMEALLYLYGTLRNVDCLHCLSASRVESALISQVLFIVRLFPSEKVFGLAADFSASEYTGELTAVISRDREEHVNAIVDKIHNQLQLYRGMVRECTCNGVRKSLWRECRFGYQILVHSPAVNSVLIRGAARNS